MTNEVLLFVAATSLAVAGCRDMGGGDIAGPPQAALTASGEVCPAIAGVLAAANRDFREIRGGVADGQLPQIPGFGDCPVRDVEAVIECSAATDNRQMVRTVSSCLHDWNDTGSEVSAVRGSIVFARPASLFDVVLTWDERSTGLSFRVGDITKLVPDPSTNTDSLPHLPILRPEDSNGESNRSSP